MRNRNANNRTLDGTDHRIIAEVQQGGRISNREIARRIGLSEAAVRKRIDRLELEGVLQFFAAIDPAHLGLELSVAFSLHVDLAHLRRVGSALAQLGQVTYLTYTSGAYDILAVAVFPSQQAVLSFIADELGKIEGIQRVETTHVLEVAKRTFVWGLPRPDRGDAGD